MDLCNKIRDSQAIAREHLDNAKVRSKTYYDKRINPRAIKVGDSLFIKIHGYALQTIYGLSLHLIGAVWSSVTHLLLHLGRRTYPKPQEDTNAETLEEAPGPSAPLSIPEDKPSTSHPSTETLHPSHAHPNVVISKINEKQIAPAIYKTYTYSDLRKHLDNNASNSD
ncbi:hypothetical protein ALC62_09091 [Cyphomyrmex costatus]|uniref:Uncharacterized protein n=1 Tax=Cyphomyrmex costatus TaxID=456900 RepID=A0A151IG06_9HYME|nr:hypothetical protein ALC62_09091 [Cyphomyrmex costatus]